MVIEAKLTRLQKLPDRVLGRLDIDGKTFSTLEPPDLNNKPNKSCIPRGCYSVIRRWSQHYKMHFYLLDVPGRDYILIHVGNYPADTRGCILVGEGFSDIDGDGRPEVINSRKALNALLDIVKTSDSMQLMIDDFRSDNSGHFAA